MTDDEAMTAALSEARAAAAMGEAPIGAVILDPASAAVVARGHNRTIMDVDPTAHAEIVAMRAAAKAVGNHRLGGFELFVTLEPCAMCAGAIVQARFARVVFAAPDPKGGGVLHGPRVFDQPTSHHKPEIVHGLHAEEAGDLLRAFFRARRGRQD